MLDNEKLNELFLKSGTKERCPLSPLSVNMSTIRERGKKRKKTRKDWKSKKMNLSPDGITVYLENQNRLISRINKEV